MFRQVTNSEAICDSEIAAYNNCFNSNLDSCYTAACYEEVLDLDTLTTQSTCARAVGELCDSYTCCSECAEVGAAVVDCSADYDGCPQRCSGAGSMVILGGLVFVMASTLLVA